MSKNKSKKEADSVLVTILLAVLILAAVIAVVLLLSQGGERNGETDPSVPTEPTLESNTPVSEPTDTAPTEPSEAPQNAFPYEIPGFTLLPDAETGALEGGLELLGVGRYTGAYFEDGSDEEVADVYAVVVRNNAENWADFAVVTLSCGERTLTFELSALPGSTAALVLESGRQSWNESETCRNPHAVCTADTSVHIYSFDDTFALYPADGVINIQNISEQTFEDDILVYYKNFDYGLFLGGITYRARFSGLAPQQIGQSIERHYTDARSMILYLSYDR